MLVHIDALARDSPQANMTKGSSRWRRPNTRRRIQVRVITKTNEMTTPPQRVPYEIFSNFLSIEKPDVLEVHLLKLVDGRLNWRSYLVVVKE
jgi:hypothetical protein